MTIMQAGKKYKLLPVYNFPVVYTCMYAGELAVLSWNEYENVACEFAVPRSGWKDYVEYKEPVVHKRWVHVYSAPSGVKFLCSKQEQPDRAYLKSWKHLMTIPIQYVEE